MAEKKSLSSLLGYLAMGVGGGLTGKDYIKNFQDMKMKQAELEKKNTYEAAMADFLGSMKAGGANSNGMGVTGMTLGPSGPSLTIGQTPENKNLMDARKSLSEWTSNATDAAGALSKIESYAKKLPQYKSGFGNQLWAKADAWSKDVAKDPAFAEYMGVVSQEMIPMARKLMEEKGPITEFDVARVEKGFGDITTPLPQKIKLIGELRGKLQKAAKNKMEASKMSELEFAGNFPSLYVNLFPEKAAFIQRAKDKGVDDKTIAAYLKDK